jgi:RimJ/RimL family protein N-acetyltransferase
MLTGTNIGLRAIEEGDLEQLLIWRNKPKFRCFFREYRELNLVQQKKWFADINQRDSKSIMFSIVELSNQELLGACGLCYLDLKNRSADLSIYIGKDDMYIDKEYAPDSLKALIKYAYDELNLHRLWTEIYEEDTAKKELYESLSFKVDGLHRDTHFSNGKWGNSWILSDLKTDLS